MNLKVLAAEPKIGMTGAEAESFLNRGQLLLRLGTVDAKGDPNVHTTWYIYETGKLYLMTGKNSRKAQNLKLRSRAYFCVDDQNPPQKGVRGKATVRLIEETNRNIGTIEKLLVKYLGNSKGPLASSLLDHARTGSEITVELTPEYFTTWDYAKMADVDVDSERTVLPPVARIRGWVQNRWDSAPHGCTYRVPSFFG